jgi:hypothetical protein
VKRYLFLVHVETGIDTSLLVSMSVNQEGKERVRSSEIRERQRNELKIFYRFICLVLLEQARAVQGKQGRASQGTGGLEM